MPCGSAWRRAGARPDATTCQPGGVDSGTERFEALASEFQILGLEQLGAGAPAVAIHVETQEEDLEGSSSIDECAEHAAHAQRATLIDGDVVQGVLSHVARHLEHG